VSQFEARDPQFELVVRDSFARQTLMSTIGAEMIRVTPGEVTIELPFRDGLACRLSPSSRSVGLHLRASY
jgi:acyl-coenzyme A thioesterase PaaI-like protein